MTLDQRAAGHGFPGQPTALAFEPVDQLLAIGAKNGSVRIIGRNGVDLHLNHHSLEPSVLQLSFVTGQNSLISILADGNMYQWQYGTEAKCKITATLKLQREKVTACHLPLNTKWCYVGSERGNVYVVNAETFSLSGRHHFPSASFA